VAANHPPVTTVVAKSPVVKVLKATSASRLPEVFVAIVARSVPRHRRHPLFSSVIWKLPETRGGGEPIKVLFWVLKGLCRV
jgi:hypothetical protein